MIEKLFNTKITVILLLVFAICFTQCKKQEEEVKEPEQGYQTITSTVDGGQWDDPATWTEGVVPTENNDAVITGRVIVSKNAECLNLMIDFNAQLEVEKDVVLKVYSHVIQEGPIIKNGDILVGDEITE